MTAHRVTIVNHCAVPIERTPERLWAALDSEYGKGEGFARAGYEVDPLDDPAAPLGGYRLRLERDGTVDERICRITERDASAMRISVHVDYLSSEASNMTVFATYRAEPAGDTATYHLDCHSILDIDVGADGSREDVARAVATLRDNFDQGIAQRVAAVKDWIEGADA